MTEEGDKPAPTAEQEVLEDTDKPDQPVEDNPPEQMATETEKETETPKPDKTTVENRPAPTKTGKMVVCRVIMLDARTEDIEVDKGAEGRVLFDKVCKSIKLQEVEYFGLTYIGARDVKFWLNMDKKISKQLKGDRWVFEFAVKFYPPEPSFLLHDYTKYLLCLQVRIDVFNGRLPCSLFTHAILGAYTVQADIGDYESPKEGRSEIDYLRDFDFAPTPSEELLHKIFDLHKTLKGMEDVDAEELLLENAKKLAMYGVDLHKAKDSQNVNILIGISASGVTIYKEKLRINRFVWPKILKLSYKRSNFYVKLRPAEGDTTENSICFKLENHKMAKLVWKTCVEHHAFFRLKEAEPPKKGTHFPRFNSRFRYSGRTQKQIQDGAKTQDKQKESFERRPIKRPDANYIDRNSDHPLDEKDRLDHMHRDPAMISSTGPPPYSQDADRLNQAESRADKPGYLPGEAEDRLDKEQDQTATLERRPIESGQTDAEIGPGITPVGRKSKRSKEEKEREKREKEEEKRRKKEEEKKRKQQEKENKKKKDLEKSTTEDRTDKLGPEDATLTAGGARPDSAELQHEGITLAVTAPVGDGSPEKEEDNEKDKDKETDGEKEPSSPTAKEGKSKSKKDKKKDKKGDKHKDDKEKDDKDKDDKDKKGSKKGRGLFGSGRKPKRSDSKSKQSDSEPSSPVSPGFDVTASPTSPPGGTLENQEVQGHPEVTSPEDESGQDKGIVKEIDNSKSNGRKKEVKFIDECESDKIEEQLNPTQTNNVTEQVIEEITPAVVTSVNTMPENQITSNSEEQAIIKHDKKESSEINVVTQEKKEDKSSEQVIPDENIEDEVFETEAESVEKVGENKNDTKEETKKETQTQVEVDSNTDNDLELEVKDIKVEKEDVVIATNDESKVCDNSDKNLKENDTKVLAGEELEKETVKVKEDEVIEVSSLADVNNIKDKPESQDAELSNERLTTEQEVGEPKVVHVDEENEEKAGEVVVNPGEVIEECVDKGEVILPVVVATEEAGNNKHEENVEVTGAEGDKVENKVDEKEEKRKKNEEKKRQKEEEKKEKERLKKEEKERKRLEKEEKKKEKEMKKKLEKEKKEKEKQMKKSKKSSSVSPAVEEAKEDECQGQVEAEAPPSSPVDPVQVELAVALQQRKKQNEDEENSETKQPDVSEPVESPENTPVQETHKTQECENPSQEGAKDQPSQENVPSENTDKPSDSTPPVQEGESTDKAEGGEDNKQDQENGAKVEAVKPKKSKKEKKEKPKKEKKDKKKKHDSTGCFAFMKKPKKPESDEEPAPVEDMPTEPWNKDAQEQQEAVTEEVVQEEKVTPKQRGVGLGWALPAFEEMKERQAAAAAAREAKSAGSENEKPRSCSLTSLKSSSSSSSSSDERVQRVPQAPLADLSEGLSVEAGLDGEGDWPVDREGSIDRKMQFIAVTPPTTETKDMNGVPEEGGMPFFDPLVGTDVNGEPVKVKKVPPPVPPKGVRGSSDLDNMSEEDRLRYMGADGLPPTVATESMKYAPDTDETPIATTNFPTVKTETRTVTYEKDGIPVAIEDGILISSQSHSTRTQTIETTTYKTERDGMVETRMEKKVIISDDNNDIDHDQLLADAIRAVTEMDQNMSVEKIECTRQIEN